MEKETYDFPVALQPIFTMNPVRLEDGGSGDDIKRKKAVVRQDTGAVLGIVSDQYRLLEHKDVIESFRTALEGVDYTEKISVARDGAQLFASYRLNSELIEVQKGDLVSLQFIVKNSYDGTNALQILLGAYRLVCTNGMVIGKQFFTFSQKHIGEDVSVKIGTIQDKVEMLRGQFVDTLPHLQLLSRTDMVLPSDELFSDEYVSELPTYLVEAAKTSYDGVRDFTVWGFYNSLTNAITHNMKRESPETSIRYGKIAWDLAQKAVTPE